MVLILGVILNTLTKDKGTSNLGQGCSVHTTLVKLDKFINC